MTSEIYDILEAAGTANGVTAGGIEVPVVFATETDDLPEGAFVRATASTSSFAGIESNMTAAFRVRFELCMNANAFTRSEVESAFHDLWLRLASGMNSSALNTAAAGIGAAATIYEVHFAEIPECESDGDWRVQSVVFEGTAQF